MEYRKIINLAQSLKPQDQRKRKEKKKTNRGSQQSIAMPQSRTQPMLEQRITETENLSEQIIPIKRRSRSSRTVPLSLAVWSLNQFSSTAASDNGLCCGLRLIKWLVFGEGSRKKPNTKNKQTKQKEQITVSYTIYI